MNQKKDYFTTKIQLTLYLKDYADYRLYKRLKRENDGHFVKKTFEKNTIDKVVQEPDFYKCYKHFSQSDNLDESLERLNTVAFLYVVLDMFEALNKVEFFVSERDDTQKVFRDGNEAYKFVYSTKRMKLDLRRAYKSDLGMNQEVAVQEAIQEFKKMLRNGYYDRDLMGMMLPKHRVHHRAVQMYLILTQLKDDTKDKFKVLINYVLNAINAQQIINSNPVVMVE